MAYRKLTGDDKTEMKKGNIILDGFVLFFEIMLLMIIVLDCNSIFRIDTAIMVNLQALALKGANWIAALLICLLLLRDKRKGIILRQHLLLFIVSFVFAFEFNALNALPHGGYGFLGYTLVFVNLMLILFRMYKADDRCFHLLILLEYMILVLAVISLCLWVGSSVLELWGRNADIKVNWGGFYSDTNYLNLCIRRYIPIDDTTKNLGIFIEPPMYGLFLGYGFCTELFLKKKSNPLILVVFFLTLISNRAILAILISMGAIFLKYLELVEGRKFARILTPLLMLLGFTAAVMLVIYKYQVGWGSFAPHVDDFAACFKCWLHNPILGCGFDNPYPIKQYMSDYRSFNMGLSNSAAVVLAEGGIVLFLYYFLPFVILMSAYFQKNKKIAYWAVCMCMFWIVVIFHVRLFVFFLLALGYSMLDLEYVNKRLHFGIELPMDNLSEEKGNFQLKILCLPKGVAAVMDLVLVFAAVYGLMNAGRFSLKNTIVSGGILVLEIVFVVIRFQKKNWNRTYLNCIEIGFWLFYMICGQAYRVFDHFYTLTDLHIQTCWWHSIVAAVILIAAGVIFEKIQCFFGKT